MKSIVTSNQVLSVDRWKDNLLRKTVPCVCDGQLRTLLFMDPSRPWMSRGKTVLRGTGSSMSISVAAVRALPSLHIITGPEGSGQCLLLKRKKLEALRKTLEEIENSAKSAFGGSCSRTSKISGMASLRLRSYGVPLYLLQELHS